MYHHILPNNRHVTKKYDKSSNIPFQSLGNHEFDDGINGLRPFIKNTDYPLLCANCDFAKYPDLVGSKSNRGIKPYEVINIEGENGKQTKIGIIGYLTTDTPVRPFIKLLEYLKVKFL